MRSGRRALAAACLLTLLGAGCTPSDPPAPPATTTPSPTPTENAQEREERLAYEAAEKSYREFRAEFYRVLRAGGAGSATPTMKSTAAGPYLSEATEIVQAYKGENAHSKGEESVTFVRGDGYASNKLELQACDDTTKVKTYDQKGKLVSQGQIRLSQLSVRFVDGAWKVWSGTGKQVSSCDV